MTTRSLGIDIGSTTTKLVLTEGAKGMKGAIARAEELARELGGAENGGELNAGGLRTPDAGAGALDTMERTRQRSREAVRPR